MKISKTPLHIYSNAAIVNFSYVSFFYSFIHSFSVSSVVTYKNAQSNQKMWKITITNDSERFTMKPKCVNAGKHMCHKNRGVCTVSVANCDQFGIFSCNLIIYLWYQFVECLIGTRVCIEHWAVISKEKWTWAKVSNQRNCNCSKWYTCS